MEAIIRSIRNDSTDLPSLSQLKHLPTIFGIEPHVCFSNIHLLQIRQCFQVGFTRNACMSDHLWKYILYIFCNACFH